MTTLSRDEITKGLLAEMDDFEALIRSISDEEWSRPSRCEGWTVAGVAAHAIGSMADVVNGNLDGLGTPEVTQREVDERAGRSPAQLADELIAVRTQAEAMLPMFDDAAWEAKSPGTYEGTLGDGVEALWFDFYMHADDIRAASGRPSEPSDGLRAAASHVATELTKRSWGPATIALDGLPEFAVNGGGGRRIDGDPLAFVLAATGRTEPSTVGLDASVNLYAA
jgi:uncharacterized protein (TIGR03083 family)